MQLRIFAKGFHYAQDGPGNRLIYHLCGCNLHCPWCANPEGLFSPGKSTETDDIVREVLSCRPMFFDNGGVTFSGGECTLQASALLPVIHTLRENGISVAVESNAATETFFDVAAQCDTVIADYKHPFAEQLAIHTGGNLARIEENLMRIAAVKPLHIRIPLIHSFNDSADTQTGFLSFFRRMTASACSFDIELLPYHEFGKVKWAQCGKSYCVTDGFVAAETVASFSTLLQQHGITVINT